MSSLSSQLALGLSLKDEATFDNFFPGKNSETVCELKKTASGLGERFIYVCSTKGQGATHLLQAACHHAHTHRLRSVFLPCANLLPLSYEVLNGLESLDLICIDDLQVIGGRPEWEEAIFHLYNRVWDAGGRIIIVAHDLPKAINIQLPDLISRLSWGMLYQLHPLSDLEKLSVLMMRADYRGMNLSEEVGNYLLTHSSRHMGHLFAALDALDKASLAAKRRLTIPFVKEVLKL